MPMAAPATDTRSRPEWAAHFDAVKSRGTIVIYDAARDRMDIHDTKRAAKGFLPASTFKIANSLIALETGAVSGVDEIFVWDKKRRARKEWERDLTLAEAFKLSAVPVYQEIARRIGPARMQTAIDKLHYGNRNIAGGIDTFWLSGKLRISALQQVDLLRKLDDGLLPFRADVQSAVKNIMMVESTPEYTLRAKTGTSDATGQRVAWWVGWIERKTPAGVRKVYFALNMDRAPHGKFEDRFTVARKIFEEEDMLPRKAPAERGAP